MSLMCLWCLLQLTQAGKRLSPSDPDKSRMPSATLPVWDMMRMLWRGQIGLTARSAPASNHPFFSDMSSPLSLPHIATHAAMLSGGNTAGTRAEASAAKGALSSA